MTRWQLGAIVFVSVAALAPARAQDAALFRSGVETVLVDVSVRQGARPTTGLTTADFRLTDNGVEQTIDAALLERLPIDITLVFDVSGSVEGGLLEHLKAGVRDTIRLLRPTDRLQLLSLRQVITEVFPFQAGGQIPPLDGLTASGTTSLYDGIVAAMIRVAPADRRQLIIVYTDGRDTTSISSHTETKGVALLADAVLDIVVSAKVPRAQSRPMAPPSSSVTATTGSAFENLVEQFDAQARPEKDSATYADDFLRELTSCTGGQLVTVDPKESISDAFKRSISDFRSGYVLRYTPHDVKPAGWHDVVVTVKKSGKYDIRARKGYGGE